MSTLIIEGISGEKIHAIKDFRALTGWGLKESKEAIDRVTAGEEFRLPESLIFRLTEDKLKMLDFGGKLAYRIVGNKTKISDYVALLGHYPREMSVGTLYDVLSETARMIENQELV